MNGELGRQRREATSHPLMQIKRIEPGKSIVRSHETAMDAARSYGSRRFASAIEETRLDKTSGATKATIAHVKKSAIPQLRLKMVRCKEPVRPDNICASLGWRSSRSVGEERLSVN